LSFVAGVLTMPLRMDVERDHLLPIHLLSGQIFPGWIGLVELVTEKGKVIWEPEKKKLRGRRRKA
jgi:hypothetical protein